MGIIRMIFEELQHMVIPCLITLPIIFLILFIKNRKVEKIDYKREAVIVLFWIYIAALLSVTFIPEHNTNQGINQPLFHVPDFSDPNTIIYKYSPIGWMRWMLTLGNYSELIRNIAGNILIFVPFGLLVPVIRKKTGAKVILYGFLLSLFIEISQLFMDRQTDLYDLVMNTFGVVIGYLIFLLIKTIIKKKSKV